MVTQKSIGERYVACANQAMIAATCSCSADACPLHGTCCACVEWHREHGDKPLPHCLRNLEGVSWSLRSQLH